MTEKSTPDYTLMDGPGVLKVCGDDASKWATAFCQHVRKIQGVELDEGWMLAWFANAIEGSSDVRRWRRENRDPETAAAE